MYGKKIKEYTQEGEIRDDADFARIRTEIERLLVQTMRSEGYLPIHDLRSRWSTSWLGKKYSFKLTVFAMYAGPKRANEFDFWSDWKLVKSQRPILGAADQFDNL